MDLGKLFFSDAINISVLRTLRNKATMIRGYLKAPQVRHVYSNKEDESLEVLRTGI